MRCGAHWAKSRNLIELIEDNISRKIERSLVHWGYVLTKQNRTQLLASDIGILNCKSHTQFASYQTFHFKKYSSSRPLESRKKTSLSHDAGWLILILLYTVMACFFNLIQPGSLMLDMTRTPRAFWQVDWFWGMLFSPSASLVPKIFFGPREGFASLSGL